MFMNSKRWMVFFLSLFMLCLMAQAQSAGGAIRCAMTTTKPVMKSRPTHPVSQTRKKIDSVLPSALPSRETSCSATAHSNTKKAENARIISNLINNMVYVQGGTFMMGATTEQDSDACPDEKPAHQVTLAGFYIGKYEVTQREWKAVMGRKFKYFEGDNRPVEILSWDDCQKFIQRLNTITGRKFRLPTEAEWEYAARGGNRSRGYKYSGSNDPNKVAWYMDNSEGFSHDVGTKQPNELGLYDMSGNVYEWCQDWYSDSYENQTQADSTDSESETVRILRGGCWNHPIESCRVSSRMGIGSSAAYFYGGLRLALSE